MQDLVGGRIDYMCNYISTSLPQIEAGAVKPIALLAPRRSPALPDLATAHEQGLKDFDADVWTAFFLPKGTPSTIVQRLARATSDALDTPAVRQRFADSLRLAVAPAWPAEPVGVAQPATRRMQSRTPLVLVGLYPIEAWGLIVLYNKA